MRIAGVMMAGLVGATLSVAQDESLDISGRWQQVGKSLTLDISRCGDNWCGIAADTDGACGRQVLSLPPSAISGVSGDALIADGNSEEAGQLELAPNVQVYRVRARLIVRPEAPRKLVVSGAPIASLRPMRRLMPFFAEFVHKGGPVCRSKPVS